MKFKSKISIDRLGYELMDCVKELLDIRDENHFDRFSKTEGASLQIIQDLISKGKLLHLLIELRVQRQRLGWFAHPKFCNQLSKMEKLLLTEISEYGFDKKEIRELHKTLLIADSYISQERQSQAGKASKGNSRYTRQIRETGPQACAKAASYYHGLATATVAGLGHEKPLQLSLWGWLCQFLLQIKEGFKDSDLPKMTRSVSRNSSTVLKTKIYTAAADYYLQTTDSNNVALKAKLILLYMSSEEYLKACTLIADLLPNYPNIPDLEYYKKGESNSVVHKMDLSLIMELAVLLEKAKSSCSSYEACLFTLRNIPSVEKLLIDQIIAEPSIKESAEYILTCICVRPVVARPTVLADPRRTNSARAGRNISNVVQFDPSCAVSKTPTCSRRGRYGNQDKENLQLGTIRGRARAASGDPTHCGQMSSKAASAAFMNAPLHGFGK